MAFGYFIDSETDERVAVLSPDLEHLPDTRLSGVWRYLFPWVRIPRYGLLAPIIYVDPTGLEWVVPAGFEFDGGSIPFFLRWLYRPDRSSCLPGFALHDWLCTEPHPCDSKTAHTLLYSAIRANGEEERTARSIHWAVTRFGPRFEKAEFPQRPLYEVTSVDGGYLATLVDTDLSASGESSFDALTNLQDIAAAKFRLFSDKERILGEQPRRQLNALRRFLRVRRG